MFQNMENPRNNFAEKLILNTSWVT